MHGLAVLAGLFLMGFGFSRGGWLGAFTGFVSAVGIGSGLAIARGEDGTEVAEANSNMGRSQRVGGIVAAAFCLAGSWYGGWDRGWLWGVGGYLAGMLSTVIAGMLLRKN